MGKRHEYERRIEDLEKIAKTKQEQEEKIEEYVNKLVQAHKETKEDLCKVLTMQKEGKPVSPEYYNKYISQQLLS